MKKILNYTTDVPANKTINEIQTYLIKSKANSIRTDFDDSGKVTAIYFQLNVDGKVLPFKLPAKVNEAYKVMYANSPEYSAYYEKRLQQAERTAWRIILVWLKSQIALIELNQVKPEEIFLPYLVVGNNKTLFEQMQDNQFLLSNGK